MSSQLTLRGLWHTLALLLFVLHSSAAEYFPFLEPVRPARRLGVMAHRGASMQAPENSRAALARCIEDEFEWAEVDVRLTADGQHVLCHDSQVRDATQGAWVVSEHTLAELKQLDTGLAFASKYAGERLLTLRECLAFSKGKLNLYLDCKAVNPEMLVREILEAGMERQVVVYDSMSRLQRVRAFAQDRVARMAKWHPDIDALPWINSNHLAAVEIDASEITPEITRTFHELGVKVEAKVLGEWDQPDYWNRSARAGADWLQTDAPEEVLSHALWQRVKTRPVRFSLHRGAGRYAPENTLPAFEKAIRLGADFVEFDVRTTSDGKFYLLHNATLDGQTDGKGPIAATPSAVVDTLSAGVHFGGQFKNARVPSLEEFLLDVKGKVDLYFDAKAIAPEALAAAVSRHGLAERTVVYQSVPYLLQLKKINPRIRALAPLRKLEQLPSISVELHPYAVDADWNILSKELIDRCHALGIRVFSDALGDHEEIEEYLQAMDWGIDLIQTDCPMKLLRAIELRAAGVR